ncbi:MAG: ABC transporter permease subunit [Paraclostridium sp.]
MKKLIILELKQRFKSKRTWIVFAIAILSSFLVTIFSMNSDRDLILNDSNKVEYTSGKKTINYLKQTQKEFEGYVTPEKLIKIAEDYTNLVNEYSGINTNIPEDIYAKEITPISNILDIISYSFTTGYEGEFDKNGLFPNGFKPELAKDTYEKRYQAQKYLLSDDAKANMSLINTIKTKEDKVQKPFYFSSYIGWDSLELNYSLILNAIIVLLACILVSPIFSKEYESGSDRVLRSTKNGRNKLAISKIISSLIISIVLYLCSILFSFLLACSVFNINGLKTSIQFVNLFSSAPLNIGQLLCINLFGGMIAVITMVCFTLFLSASMNSSVVVLAISSMLVVVNNIFNLLSVNNIENNKAYFFINSLSPFGGSTISTSTLVNNYLSIGAFNLWLPYCTLIFSIILIFVFFKLTIKNYCNHQQ